jgi:hypothetical protein
MTTPLEPPVAEDDSAEHAKKPTFRIQIDRHHYEVHEHHMTGAELRHVPEHTIPESRDLYEIRHDGRDDELISLTDEVHIRDGLRFFTAPGRINPGLK